MSAQKIIEMKEKRANITLQIRSLIDEFEGKEIPQEKKDELRNLENEFDGFNEKLLTEERQLERERLAGEKESKPVQEKRTEDNSEEKKEKEVRALFGKYLRSGSEHAISEYRAIQQDNPTQAGYLVAPQKFVGEVIQEKNNLTFMRQISRVLPALEKAASLGFPKRTARMSTFAWGGEIQAPTPDSALAFGKREFMPRPATGGILVSKTLVRNSAINVDQYVRNEMAYNAATNEEQGFMTGSGAVGEPLGVFTASGDGISTARDISTGNTATEIKFDGLYEAKYSIKEQYQNGLNWAFHRDAVKQIAKLKDGEGQYIWQQSVQLGQPDRLLSYPVRMSEYAPNTFTTGEYVGILGDFRYYWICDSLYMEMQALLELYALTNQIFYIGRHEVDGMPVLDEAFARVKLG